MFVVCLVGVYLFTRMQRLNGYKREVREEERTGYYLRLRRLEGCYDKQPQFNLHLYCDCDSLLSYFYLWLAIHS